MATKMEILKLKYFGSQAKSVYIIIVNFQYLKKILIILHKQLINNYI